MHNCSISPCGVALGESDLIATVVTQSSHPMRSVESSLHVNRHLCKSARGASAERSINVIC